MRNNRKKRTGLAVQQIQKVDGGLYNLISNCLVVPPLRGDKMMSSFSLTLFGVVVCAAFLINSSKGLKLLGKFCDFGVHYWVRH